MMQDTHRGYTELRQVTDGSSESATNETAVAYYNPRTRDVAWMDEDITLPNWTDYYTYPLYTTPPDHREVMQQALEALTAWDATITHQYTGSREAMTDMHDAMQGGLAAIDALRKALGEQE